MSIAILAYKIPEEDYEYEMAVSGGKYHRALYELHKEIRDKRKYGHDFKSIEECIEWMYDTINYEMNEAGIQD